LALRVRFLVARDVSFPTSHAFGVRAESPLLCVSRSSKIHFFSLRIEVCPSPYKAQKRPYSLIDSSWRGGDNSIPFTPRHRLASIDHLAGKNLLGSSDIEAVFFETFPHFNVGEVSTFPPGLKI